MSIKIKKLSLVTSILSTFLLFSSSCSNENISGNTLRNDGTSNKVVVDIFQTKVEIADQLKNLTDQYTKEHPNITFNIESVGGGEDSASALKAKFASGNPPDLFTNEGNKEAEIWKSKLEDLSDQPWVKDAYDYALEPMKVNGKIYGQPTNLEGYGFIYNKELFVKAGIKKLPKTFSELEGAARKLKTAGITPFSNGYGEWWILGQHGINIPFSYQEDSNDFINELYKGKTKIEGNEAFKKYLELLDLTLKYGNNNPLTTDYNTQVTKFANGEAAMIQQGNWIQPMLDKIKPNMKLGILPIPLSDDEVLTDKLAVGVPTSWVIYNKAPEADKKAAKEFLTWMVTSKIGKRALVKDFKYIPAFKTIEPKGIGPLGNEVLKYSKKGKTFSWKWIDFPDGVKQEFGVDLQEYIAGQKSKEDVLKTLDVSWDKLNRE
ncbi:ABC transporter substrate-binding protein [Priestia megaterium]|uniref:ABC transporter substrate-binding protein n=1 Tax=Priestia megaterium TaxID=1404 RepID=UPI000BFA0741|nr:ABC transporter substrate-binding protein [Priestia megaterium]PFA99858.1 ABC transporter substrate-binding protein [Priestia megaterium]